MSAGNVRLAIGLASVFFILGLFRINDLSMYTDSTRYLIWGHSLSEFNGYVDDTRPIPDRFVMNAPLYPLFLAPLQWILPFSVEAAKIWTLFLGSLALGLFFLWVRRYFTLPLSLVLTLLLAFNPLFLTISTEILSEAPFMAMMGIILLAADGFFAGETDRRTRIAFLACIALIMLLREVGAAFVIASVVILFRQKRGRDLLLAASLSGGLFLLWTLRNSVLIATPEEGQAANIQYLFRHFVTSENTSLFSEFLTRAWLNFKGYVVTMGGRILYPFPENLIVAPSPLYGFFQTVIDFVRIPLLTLAVAGTVIGMWRDRRSGPAGEFRLMGFAGYLVIILLYPVHDLRFFLPLLPLLYFYLGKGWHTAAGYLRDLRFQRAVAGLTLVLLLLPNATAVWEMLRTNSAYRSDPANFCLAYETSPEQPRYFDQPWSLIGGWIREHSPEDALIASPVKEIAPFVYPRPVLETSRVLLTPMFERYLRDFEASYLVTVNVWDSVETFQYQMSESRRLWFDPAFSLAGAKIYGIHSSILEPRHRRPTVRDTTTERGLLLAGREAMLEQRYHNALDLFGKCLKKSPSQPEVAFQIVSALSFLGDSVGAMNMVELLFTLPKSTAYAQSVQSTLAIMEQTLKAKRYPNPSARSFGIFETGLAFWGLGYREAARSAMREVVRLDSTNFVGALWGIHIAREMGDTLESNRFLERLKRIDRNAQIVGDWEAIRHLGETISRPGARRPVDIHLALARVYAKIELFDEAIDAILRALRLEPGNVDAWLYKGEVLEKKKASWGAAAAYRQVLKLEPHNSFAQTRLDSLSQ